jgi:hypothetical protein
VMRREVGRLDFDRSAVFDDGFIGASFLGEEPGLVIVGQPVVLRYRDRSAE